jgi:hypothetical protein
MDNIFKDVSFWLLYSLMESNLDRQNFDNQLKKLIEIFKYNKKTLSEFYEENLIEFEFYCGKDYSIILEYSCSHHGEWAESESSLFLKDKVKHQKSLMGWRDMAQWHPLCIKPDEFALLLNYWFEHDPIWSKTNYPKLLLRKFVGFQIKNK